MRTRFKHTQKADFLLHGFDLERSSPKKILQDLQSYVGNHFALFGKEQNTFSLIIIKLLIKQYECLVSGGCGNFPAGTTLYCTFAFP